MQRVGGRFLQRRTGIGDEGDRRFVGKEVANSVLEWEESRVVVGVGEGCRLV